eukprot:11169820-Lingulodinium_polyedra.AAC.1
MHARRAARATLTPGRSSAQGPVQAPFEGSASAARAPACVLFARLFARRRVAACLVAPVASRCKRFCRVMRG